MEEAEGGNVGRFRIDFEGRADSMADVSDEGGFENTELLAIERRGMWDRQAALSPVSRGCHVPLEQGGMDSETRSWVCTGI